jgi:predicted permease
MSMVAQIEPGNKWIDERDSFNSFVVGRMKPGVTMPQAQAALNTILADLAREYPKINAGMRIVLSPPGLFGSFLRDYIRIFAAVLMGLAGLVLLIACVNLASLLLARATDRRRDTAIRLALGAARGDLIRQLLTESIVLSILGGAAGVLLAVWLTQVFAAWRPPMDIPVIPQLGLDWHVLAFAAAASLGTGVLFGLAPAIQSVRVDLAPALKNEAVAQRLRRFPLRDLLVTAQIAMSVVLLVGSLLVVRSLQNALSVKLGFEPRGAATVAFDLALEGYNETRAKDFQRRLMERVRSLPGIEAAGVTDSVPLSLNWNNSTIFIEGRPEIKAGDAPLAPMFVIDSGYLKAMRTPLVAGRNFDDHDRAGAPKVAIVNEAFATQLLPGENPLGKRFRIGRQDEGPWYQIVGIVENGKYRSLGESAKPAVFRSLDQKWSSYTEVIARSSLPEERVAAMLRSAVLDLDPNITLYDNGSLTSELGLVLLPARLAAGVLGSFGLLAIVLAATGVYGIMAYAVARRTREIGIRMALGARQATVLRVVLSHTAVLVAVGTGVGIGLSLAAGRIFSQILYGISATDPFTYLISIVLMAAIAAIACLVPARRAMSVDPVTALRDC